MSHGCDLHEGGECFLVSSSWSNDLEWQCGCRHGTECTAFCDEPYKPHKCAGTEAPSMGPKYYSTSAGFAECSTGYMAVTDAFECSEAYNAITGVSRRPVEGSWPDHPVGCMTHYGATGHEVGDSDELLLNKLGVGVTDQVTYRDISQLCVRTHPIEAPTEPPTDTATTDEPTSAATDAPTDAPTDATTDAPTFRQMCDAPNGCDLYPGGHCFKTGGDGWECDCAFGWSCTDGCDEPHQPNQCSQPTDAPTTAEPTTDAPTTDPPTDCPLVLRQPIAPADCATQALCERYCQGAGRGGVVHPRYGAKVLRGICECRKFETQCAHPHCLMAVRTNANTLDIRRCSISSTPCLHQSLGYVFGAGVCTRAQKFCYYDVMADTLHGTEAPTDRTNLVQAATTIKAPTDDETTAAPVVVPSSAAIGFNTVLKMDATPCFYSGQCSSISLAEIAQLQERIKTIADTAGMKVSHVTVKNVKISALEVALMQTMLLQTDSVVQETAEPGISVEFKAEVFLASGSPTQDQDSALTSNINLLSLPTSSDNLCDAMLCCLGIIEENLQDTALTEILA